MTRDCLNTREPVRNAEVASSILAASTSLHWSQGEGGPPKRLGVPRGGGAPPGLNAVIRAVVKSATNCHCEVIGLEDSFDGLIEPNRWRLLTPRDCVGILRIGGTLLRTNHPGDTVRPPVDTSGGKRDYSERGV